MINIKWWVRCALIAATGVTIAEVYPILTQKTAAENSASIAFQSNPIEIDTYPTITLDTPTFRQDAPEKVKSSPSPVTLIQISQESNNITDTEAWFAANQLTLPTSLVPKPSFSPQEVPPDIPRQYQNNPLVGIVYHPDRDLLIYGSSLTNGRYLFSYNRNSQELEYGYDFSNYALPPISESQQDLIRQGITWVSQQDNILYVSHDHRTYAESSDGMNGYITAIDTNTNQVVWRSQPQVCNSRNFIIVDSTIICGYGFTAEPDFIYILNRNSGKILQQIPVATAVDYLIQKEDKLYVRTYDTNYVFEIVQ